MFIIYTNAKKMKIKYFGMCHFKLTHIKFNISIFEYIN